MYGKINIDTLTMTSDLNAAYVTHKGKRSAEVLDIWTVEDKRNQLSVIPSLVTMSILLARLGDVGLPVPSVLQTNHLR